jgi:hypothetical protein
MNVFDALVTNRTASDAAEARAIRNRYAAVGDWSGLTAEERGILERGYYTRHSLNRVEGAVQALVGLRAAAGWPVSAAVKTDWGPSDYFTRADLERFLGNIDRLRRGFWETPELPATPPDIRPWNNANDIEAILIGMRRLLHLLEVSMAYVPYSGESHCGEPFTV